MRIVWTEPALRDLGAARAYIALDNPAAALEQIRYVLASAEILTRFPQSGRPGRQAGTRELVVNRTPFIIVYRLADHSLDLLRVLHGRQRWPDRF